MSDWLYADIHSSTLHWCVEASTISRGITHWLANTVSISLQWSALWEWVNWDVSMSSPLICISGILLTELLHQKFRSHKLKTCSMGKANDSKFVSIRRGKLLRALKQSWSEAQKLICKLNSKLKALVVINFAFGRDKRAWNGSENLSIVF